MALHTTVELEDKVGKQCRPARADGIGKQAEAGELIQRVARRSAPSERGRRAWRFGALLIGDLEIRSQAKGVAISLGRTFALAQNGCGWGPDLARRLAQACDSGGDCRGLRQGAARSSSMILREARAEVMIKRKPSRIDRVGIVTDIAHGRPVTRGSCRCRAR